MDSTKERHGFVLENVLPLPLFREMSFVVVVVSVFFLFSLCFESAFHVSLGRPGTHCVEQTGLQFVAFSLLLTPECWTHSLVPLYSANTYS